MFSKCKTELLSSEKKCIYSWCGEEAYVNNTRTQNRPPDCSYWNHCGPSVWKRDTGSDTSIVFLKSIQELWSFCKARLLILQNTESYDDKKAEKRACRGSWLPVITYTEELIKTIKILQKKGVLVDNVHFWSISVVRRCEHWPVTSDFDLRALVLCQRELWPLIPWYMSILKRNRFSNTEIEWNWPKRVGGAHNVHDRDR